MRLWPSIDPGYLPNARGKRAEVLEAIVLRADRAGGHHLQGELAVDPVALPFQQALGREPASVRRG
jgi:hypothetical protein